MNRGKHPLHAKLNKKMQKELRLAQTTGPKTKELSAYEEKLTERELAKKYPKRVSSQTHSPASLKKTQKHKKQSKRTTPGIPWEESSPKNAHMEGSRWIRTVIKQNLTQRKISAKRGSRKK